MIAIPEFIAPDFFAPIAVNRGNAFAGGEQDLEASRRKCSAWLAWLLTRFDGL